METIIYNYLLFYGDSAVYYLAIDLQSHSCFSGLVLYVFHKLENSVIYKLHLDYFNLLTLVLALSATQPQKHFDFRILCRLHVSLCK